MRTESAERGVNTGRLSWGVLLAIVSIASPRVSAEEKSAPKAEPGVKVVQTEEKGFPDIRVEFEVTGPDGQPVLDAVRDDFRVEEYDAPVKITDFHSPISREFRPTTVVLVLDRSGSMNKDDRIGALKLAVDAFLKKLPEGSRVAVIAFGDGVDLICPFTDDPREVRRAVGDLTAQGQTVFYDAVSAAIQLLSGEEGRRAILAMTDGEDNISRLASLRTVIRDAMAAGFPVHTLGLGPTEELQSEMLREMAGRTRGKSFSAAEADGLRTIFEEIAKGLGQTYSLTYRTEHRLQDGTLRPIKVFYSKSDRAGVGGVYIPGMVVPAAGWSWLFLALVAGLGAMAVLPSRRHA